MFILLWLPKARIGHEIFINVDYFGRCSCTPAYILDASVKSNKKAHHVATELVGLEFCPEFNQQGISKIDFNKNTTLLKILLLHIYETKNSPFLFTVAYDL